MLSEFDVVQAVCKELESRGYRIEQKLRPRQRGDDIIAVRYTPVTRRLFIEAKGETSSRRRSERYGRPFNSAQKGVHVAQALYKAAEVLSRDHGSVEARAGIAFPDTDRHRTLVERVQPVLTQLGIAVFWVRQNSSVQIVSAWEV